MHIFLRRSSTALVGLTIFCWLTMMGCATLGFYSRNIHLVDENWQPRADETLVVILFKQRQPMEALGKYLDNTLARAFAMRGKETDLKVDFDMAEAQVYAFHSQTYPEHFTFQQSLGQGDPVEHIHFKPDSHWKLNFSLQIKPFLNHIILDPNLRLSDNDKSLIGNWLAKEEQALEANSP